MDIICKNVSVVYDGKPALQNFSAQFHSSECVCIVGPSGSGKTTLLQVLLGFVKPSTGAVSGTKACRFCTDFQEPRLIKHLNAVDNVRLVLPSSANTQDVRALLLALGLQDADISQRADTLSGGQQKRVALARALAAPGDALLLDEPFAGLDADTATLCAKTVLAHRNGRLLLCVTHNHDDIQALAARVLAVEPVCPA